VKIPRYGPGAGCYDLLSCESLVYRRGRLQALALLELRPGDRVLDVGCGTGLNFAPLEEAVGPTGALVGVDTSPQMLAVAGRRTSKHGWHNVTLVQADAARLDTALAPSERFDAVVCTYSLSVIDDGPTAWTQAWTMLRDGGRIAVADTAPPTGWGRLLTPLAALAFVTGGVDTRRRPWQWVESDTTRVATASSRSGHVRVAVGTKPDGGEPNGVASDATVREGRG